MAGCGCGSRAAPTIPVTSGDFADGATSPGMPRFKVVRTDGEGEQTTDYYATYRDARRAQAEGGGKLRMA